MAVMSTNADRPRAKSLNPLRSLLPFLSPYRSMMIAALGALLVAAAAMLALPVALRELIDHVVAAKDAAILNRFLFGFLAASVIFGVFAALRFYLVTWLGERVVADLRSAVYRRVVRMDPLFYETTRVGEVLSRLTTDTTLVQAISGVNLSIILRSTLSLIGGLVMMGLTSAKLMGIMLVLIPVVVVPLIVIGRRVRGLSRASQDRIADTSGLAGRDLERHSDGAGLHPGGTAKPALPKCRRRQLRHRGAPHPSACGAHRDRHHAGVLRPSPSCCGWVCARFSPAR